MLDVACSCLVATPYKALGLVQSLVQIEPTSSEQHKGRYNFIVRYFMVAEL